MFFGVFLLGVGRGGFVRFVIWGKGSSNSREFGRGFFFGIVSFCVFVFWFGSCSRGFFVRWVRWYRWCRFVVLLVGLFVCRGRVSRGCGFLVVVVRGGDFRFRWGLFARFLRRLVGFRRIYFICFVRICFRFGRSRRFCLWYLVGVGCGFCSCYVVLFRFGCIRVWRFRRCGWARSSVFVRCALRSSVRRVGFRSFRIAFLWYIVCGRWFRFGFWWFW